MARGDHHRSGFGRLRRRARRRRLWRRGRRHARPHRRGLRGAAGRPRGPARRAAAALPHLDTLGLGLAMHASTGAKPPGFACKAPTGQWGYGVETSRGKDTPSGHWEIAGTPVEFDWGYFPRTTPAFPPELTRGADRQGEAPRHPWRLPCLGHRDHRAISARSICGRCKPICYTSVDSVFQIAAHEDAFGLERLYDVCRIARALVRSAQHRPRHRAAVRRRTRQDFRPHRQPQGFLDSAAARQSARARGGGGARDRHRSARSATSSRIATPGWS